MGSEVAVNVGAVPPCVYDAAVAVKDVHGILTVSVPEELEDGFVEYPDAAVAVQ